MDTKGTLIGGLPVDGVISPATVRDLVNFRGDGFYVVSFYLNVDGSRFPRRQDYEVELRSLVREAERRWVTGGALARAQRQALGRDLENIVSFVELEFVRDSTKGLAIFSCAGRRFRQVYPLPVPIPSSVIVGAEPYAKILTAALDEYKRFCTVIVDRRKARIFSVFLGQIEEHTGILEDEVPQKVKEGEWAGLRQSKIAHHIEDHVMRHLKRVAERTMVFFEQHEFDRLILGGHRELIPKFKEVLHPYLQERVAGQFLAEPDAPLKEVLERSLAVEIGVQTHEEEEFVRRLRDQAGPGGRAVLGLERTTEALMLGQVHTLAVADGYAAEGRVCHRDSYISTYLDACPACGQPLAPSPDVVEDMVQFAINQSCNVEHISHVRDFIERDKIGALLRFAV